MKKVLKLVGFVLMALILVAGIYFAYVMIDYHRIDDNQEIEVVGTALNDAPVPTGQEMEISSWNIGFAAYTADYGFFMDGGTESRAFSEEAVVDNMNSIIDRLDGFTSDFTFIQEVDTESTRSYEVNELDMLTESLSFSTSEMFTTDSNGNKVSQDITIPVLNYTYGVNYDSPYLFYPFKEPFGQAKSGIVTMSRYKIEDSLRRSLPIQTSLAKLVDLDRCYTINRIKCDNGKELVLFNGHLSAYTTDPTIVDQQIEMLNADMLAEYEKGNYVIAGGDFNKDLLGDSGKYFGVSGEDYSWAQSYPFELMPNGFTLRAPLDEANPVPSCRNADGPWDPATQFQITIDGFITSDNIEVMDCNVIDTQFENSDHNPIQMHFVLK